MQKEEYVILRYGEKLDNDRYKISHKSQRNDIRIVENAIANNLKVYEYLTYINKTVNIG